jgi:hypothetical protein
MCESAFNTAGERHMCESAFNTAGERHGRVNRHLTRQGNGMVCVNLPVTLTRYKPNSHNVSYVLVTSGVHTIMSTPA